MYKLILFGKNINIKSNILNLPHLDFYFPHKIEVFFINKKLTSFKKGILYR
jgi:hypothetical protein